MVKKNGSKATGGLSTRALVITLAIGVLLGAAAVAVLRRIAALRDWFGLASAVANR